MPKQPYEEKPIDVYLVIQHQIWGDVPTLQWVAEDLVKTGEWIYPNGIENVEKIEVPEGDPAPIIPVPPKTTQEEQDIKEEPPVKLPEKEKKPVVEVDQVSPEASAVDKIQKPKENPES